MGGKIETTDINGAVPLPPRPLEDVGDSERADVPLPWSAIPLILCLGVCAGLGILHASASSSASLIQPLVSSGYMVGGTAVMGLAVLAMIIADRVAWKWRREVRWPLFILIMAAPVLVVVLNPLTKSLRPYLMPAGRWLPLVISVLLCAVWAAALGLVFAIAARSRRGLVWKTVALTAACNIIFMHAYLLALDSIPAVSIASEWLRGVLGMGLLDVVLLYLCPLPLVLGSVVSLSLERARRAASALPGDAPASPPLPKRTIVLRRVAIVVVVLLAAGITWTQVGRTLLLRAVQQSDASAVSRWLAVGIDPNRLVIDRRAPPLHWAALDGEAEIVRSLLDAGADANGRHEPGGRGRTPLLNACGLPRHNPEVVGLLLKHGADPSARKQGGRTALCETAVWHHVETARMLIAAGADPDARTDEDVTPLHAAAESDSLPVARLLLDAGADPDVQTSWGGTPLYQAADYGNREIAEALIAAAARADLQDDDGKTALDLAVANGHDEIASAIRLAQGALD